MSAAVTSQPDPADLAQSATAALRASVKLSSGIVGVMDMLTGRHTFKLSLTNINRTATIKAMRRDAEAILAFIGELEAGAD